MSGTQQPSAGNPTGINKSARSFSGRSRISSRNPIGLGVCVKVASANGSAFPVNVLLPDDYQVRFETGPAPRDFRLRFIFGLPGSTTVVAVPSADPRPQTVKVNGIVASGEDTLVDLLDPVGAGFAYDVDLETLFIKLVMGGSGTSIMDGLQTNVTVIE